MTQVNCKLCGKAFVCDNGKWSTTCTCAKDRPEELKKANQLTLIDLVNSQLFPIKLNINSALTMIHEARDKSKGYMAIWDGEQLFVSQQVYDLLSNEKTVADTAEAIKVLSIPKFDPMKEPLPMTMDPYFSSDEEAYKGFVMDVYMRTKLLRR